MAVVPITQDPVTLAANAALQIIDEEEKESIDFVMFGTESGIDHSKSAAIYVHQLLGLKPEARSIELKQACYGATAAIQLAKGHIALHPESKVLVLASEDRKSTRLNSSHVAISYAVFCLKKKKKEKKKQKTQPTRI